MRAVALLLVILILGCLQPIETPGETAKPTEVPTTTPAPATQAPTTAPPITTPSPTETPVPTPIETIEPEKPVEIKLTFPNGTVEENRRFILGDFTENFTFRVEPEDAEVYFNDSGIDVVNGTFTISVNVGGDYTLRVIKDELEKAYNVSIGHGEIKAAYIYISPVKDGVKIFFMDGTLAINRTIIIDIERETPIIAVSDENGMVPYECGPYPGALRVVHYTDNSTGNILLTCSRTQEIV